jgi:hypothetical protein
MLPRSHEQLLRRPLSRRAGARMKSREVADRAAREYVIPAAVVERRHRNRGIVLVDTPAAPIVVVRGMAQPLEVEGHIVGGQEERVLGQRQVVVPLPRVGGRGREHPPRRLIARTPSLIGAQLARPRGVERERESASLVRPAIVVLGARHAGRNRAQRRRRAPRCQQLSRPYVRPAIHPDSAVRPGQRCRPLDRIMAVETLVLEGRELAVRRPSTAHVL